MQCRCLGAAVEAWSEPDANGRGRSLIDEVRRAGRARSRCRRCRCTSGATPTASACTTATSTCTPASGGTATGFASRRTERRRGAIIYGRSDATINRHGVRMGTSELYRAVEALPEVLDSLVVDLEYLGRESWMPLFVVLRDGHALDDELVRRIKVGRAPPCRRAMCPTTCSR